MLKKQVNFRGYILLESCVAFVLVTVLLLEIIPLVVSVREYQRAGQQRLEVYRYFSELALEYQVHREIGFREKISHDVVIRASGSYSAKGVVLIQLETGDEQFEIVWLGGTVNDDEK